MSRLAFVLVGVMVGVVGGVRLVGWVRNDDLRTAARACLHSHGNERTDCFNDWFESRGKQAPWPEIREADRERVTQLERAKAPRQVLP